MGEYLLEVTIVHIVIIAILSATTLILLAYKKPNYYESTSRLLIICIGLFIFYRLGWQGSIEHHHVIRVNQSNIPNNFMGLFYLIVLLDISWLRGVAKNRLEESKSDGEES